MQLLNYYEFSWKAVVTWKPALKELAGSRLLAGEEEVSPLFRPRDTSQGLKVPVL